MGGGGGLPAGDPHHVVQAPGAGLAQDRLGPRVEVAGVELVAMLLRIDLAPAGERPRGLADVALGVMPFAQGEELEELAPRFSLGWALVLLRPSSQRRMAPSPSIRRCSLLIGARQSSRWARFCASINSGELTFAWLVA